jgi:hypothetical protein
MAPKRGGGSSRAGDGDSGGDGSSFTSDGSFSFSGIESVRLATDWGNLALLVISGISLAAMLVLLIAMFKIKTRKKYYNINQTGFRILKWAILVLTLYVPSSIIQTTSDC